RPISAGSGGGRGRSRTGGDLAYRGPHRIRPRFVAGGAGMEPVGAEKSRRAGEAATRREEIDVREAMTGRGRLDVRVVELDALFVERAIEPLRDRREREIGDVADHDGSAHRREAHRDVLEVEGEGFLRKLQPDVVDTDAEQDQVARRPFREGKLRLEHVRRGGPALTKVDQASARMDARQPVEQPLRTPAYRPRPHSGHSRVAEGE